MEITIRLVKAVEGEWAVDNHLALHRVAETSPPVLATPHLRLNVGTYITGASHELLQGYGRLPRNR